MSKFSRAMTNPSIWMEGLFSGLDKYDVFGNNDTFQVKVLDNPRTAGDEITFTGRIIDSRMAHESFLPDPCDQTVASNEILARSIANLHTTIIVKNASEFSQTISRDDIVLVKFNPGQNENKYDLHTGDFVKVFRKSNRNGSTNDVNCTSLTNLDFSGGSFTSAIFAAVNIPFEDISSGQKSFYKGREVANGRLPEDILASPWTVTDDFFIPRVDTKDRPILFIEDLIEPFRELCREYYETFNEKIVINDSYRSYERQLRLAETSRFAATPGYSNHGWGVAFDVNGTNTPYPQSSRSIKRFQSPVYLFLDKQGSGTQGFVNPPSLRYDGRLPESWHWENTTVRNAVYDKNSILLPEYTEPDGTESLDGED